MGNIFDTHLVQLLSSQDYTREDVTVENFFVVLLGNKIAVNEASGKVLSEKYVRKVGLRKIGPLLWLTGFEISPNTFVSASIFSTKYASLRLAKVGKPEVPAEPNCLLHGHDGPAYDVKFYGDGEDSLLLSCGDDGRIRRWKWMDVMEAKQDGLSKSGDLKAHLDMANPEHKSLGALSPIHETNAMAVDGLLASHITGVLDLQLLVIRMPIVGTWTSLDYDGERVVYGSTIPVLDGEELTMILLVYLFNNATSTSVKASLKIGQMAPV
ncbi:THO complex subunit 6 [Tanacetum coccineum]